MRTYHSRGATLIYTTVVVAVLMGIMSLGVEWGRVQLVKTELQRAADAAARYAVTGIADGSALSKAYTSIGENAADGVLLMQSDSNVTTGVWDDQSRTFTPNLTPANAVHVAVHRQVPLKLAAMFYSDEFGISADAIAVTTGGASFGYVGLGGVEVKNNFIVANYNSSDDTSPTSSDYDSLGAMASNGEIEAKNNIDIGQLILGPDGSSDYDTDVIVLNAPIPTPVIDPGNAASTPNPGGIPRNYEVTGTKTLAGGTYYFTNLELKNNAKLLFSGPATVYVNGDIELANNAQIRAYQDLPGNLKIRQMGNNTFEAMNNALIIADIQGPHSKFEVMNNAKIFGQAIFQTIEAKNNAEFYFDQALAGYGTGGAGGAVLMVR